MKIRDTKGEYFYFKFEPKDYNEQTYLLIRRFMNAFKKEFGHKERYWMADFKTWAIKKQCRQRFNELIDRYFYQKQKSLYESETD